MRRFQPQEPDTKLFEMLDPDPNIMKQTATMVGSRTFKSIGTPTNFR
jgi:hypothetical protein